MVSNYWNSTLNRRVSRRRALAFTGATATGALLLACSGKDDTKKGNASGDTPEGLAQAKDQTSEGKIAGPMKGANLLSASGSFEPYTQGGGSGQGTLSRLWLVKDGHFKNTAGELDGDLVASWEISPDRLTITAKLDPDRKFAPLAPVNGRAVDAQDIVFSYTRHKTMSTSRTDYWREVAPTAPIESIKAIDARTVQIKVATPTATILSLLARDFAGDFHILPKEDGIDFRQPFAGSGPWYVTDVEPSIGAKLRKNPGYKDKLGPIPFIDVAEMPTITDYAQQMAQFRAGNLYNFPAQMVPEDILQTKNDFPVMEMMESPNYFSRVQRFGFGQSDDSPFRDERVRQAFYATIDKELLLLAGAGAETLEKAGFPTGIRFEGALENGAPGWEGWILDPQDEKEFGPNSVNFKFDVARAKQLLTAAGHTGQVESNMYIVAPPTSPFFLLQLDSIAEMANTSGLFKITRVPVANFAGEFAPNYQTQIGRAFKGLAISLSSGVGGVEPANYLFYHYNEAGSRRQGYDATLTDLTSKAITEFDADKRKALVQDIQRYEGKVLFFPRLGANTSYTISWPILRNRNVWVGGSGRAGLGWGFNSTHWLDLSKPPVGNS
jgi:peptide/nickel transport system substrate-binding protein